MTAAHMFAVECSVLKLVVDWQVFCGKIPKEVLEDELIPLFEKCGTVWDLRLMMDPMTKQCRSFCFVTFTDKAGVDTAVKQVHMEYSAFLSCICSVLSPVCNTPWSFVDLSSI